MKKLIFTLLLALYSLFGFSQVLFESFENTTGPDPLPSTNWTLGSGNWISFNNGIGLTYSWSIWNSPVPVEPPFVYAGLNAAYVRNENIGDGNTSEDYLVTPLITVPSNGEISFYSRTFVYGNQGTLYQIKICTGASNPADPNSYTLLTQFTESELSTVFNIYEEKTVDLSAYTGTPIHIAFVRKHTQSGTITGDRWLLDNVTVQSHPTCEKPNNLAVMNSTPTSVTLDWNENNGATSWEIIAVPNQTAVVNDATTGQIVTSHPFTITGLDPYTYYSFYVRAICSSTVKSNWSTSLSYITPETCPEPSDIIITNINFNSIEVGWINNSTATSWEVVALPCGTNITPTTTGIITSSNPYTLVGLNPDTCYTTYVRAICSPTDKSLWTASYNTSTLIPPPNCGSYFVDNGGTYGNYSYNSDYVYTICPTSPGEVVTITFNAFNVEATFDGMYIFDGNSQSAPQIPSSNGIGNGNLSNLAGAFWGNLNTNLPGPFTSTSLDGCLTFHFYSNSSVVTEGWNASISCGPPDRINLIAFVDQNENGIKDAEEINYTNGSFVYEQNNSGTNTVVYSQTGYYSIFDTSTTNTYNVSYQIQPEVLPCYSLGATTSYSNITIPAGSFQTLYFPILSTQPCNDVTVSISANNAIAGTSFTQFIDYKNIGLSSNNGVITYTKPTEVSINYISPTGSVLNPTGFTYAFTNLAPNEERTIFVSLQVPPIPTVTIGDYLTSNVAISAPSNDINLYNNDASITQIIAASYDPNDKVESHGSTIKVEDFTTNDYLFYTIRFENTGTANAMNIRVEDELDSKLDENSVRMVSSSHNYTLSRIGNSLTWNFNNIQLPVSDPNSNIGKGYFTFKVKPNPGYVVGDIIPNTASIYFDSNPAIVTNTFNTEFVTSLGISNFESSNFIIAPNPANNDVQIILQNTSEVINHILITDVLGKKIRKINTITNNQSLIDVADLSQGIYFVEITTENNLKLVKKLVIE